MEVKHACLVDWKRRRTDLKTEVYWNKRIDTLSTYEEYQKKWNFVEKDYSYEPSNNGLDLANPAFAFDKKLVKFIEVRTINL